MLFWLLFLAIPQEGLEFGKPLIDKVLDNGFRLVITDIAERDLVLSLEKPGRMTQKITVENANIAPELIEEVELVKGEGKLYFLTAFDRSSTYGAQTSILLWKSDNRWQMTQAPYIRAEVEDPDGDGIFEIVETYPTRKSYAFSKGRFSAIEATPKTKK